MKIKTIEKLEEKLEQDIAWRKKEMLSLKIMIERDELNRKILLRSGIALLCAHFEGFIKTASNYYVVYVSGQKIKCEDIINSLLAIKLKNDFINCSKTEKTSVHSSLLDKANRIKEEKFVIRYTEENPIISTESNPKYDVLQEILKTIGITTDIFDTKKIYIDNSLLYNRHKVVHGERHELEIQDFMAVFDIVMELIDKYKDTIITAAENKLYLKQEVQYA